MTRPIVEPTQVREIATHGWRISQLERRTQDSGQDWIYVGTYPGDPLTTPDSPPFLNLCQNDTSDPDNTPMRFKHAVDGGIDMEGMILVPSSGVVVFTLPLAFRRDRTLWIPGGTTTTTGFTIWKIDNDGNVTVYVVAGITGPAGPTGPTGPTGPAGPSGDDSGYARIFAMMGG